MTPRRAILCFSLGVLSALLGRCVAHAGGNYPPGELHAWFDHLASGKGMCCSFADGVSVADVDWDTGEGAKDTDNEGGHYRVRICAEPPIGGDPKAWTTCAPKTWHEVPDNALVTEPNKFGPAVVWPFAAFDYKAGHYISAIRCFMPGSGA